MLESSQVPADRGQRRGWRMWTILQEHLLDDHDDIKRFHFATLAFAQQSDRDESGGTVQFASRSHARGHSNNQICNQKLEMI